MSRYLRENNLPLPSEVIPDWCGYTYTPSTCERCGDELPFKYRECAYCDECESNRDETEET